MALALVTGAAGVMGKRLVKGLLDAGWQVRALVLPRDPLRSKLEPLGCEIREGNISDQASLASLCDGVDTVYHLAAVILSHDPSAFSRINRDGTENVVREAVRAGVKHFIYVSSASVVYPRRTPYAESKLQAEGIVRAAPGLAFTIVRPTLVYEPGGGQELMMFLAYLERFPLVPFIGTGRAVKRPVWSQDVASGLLGLAGKPITYGKTYNLSGGEAISILELAKLLLLHHGGARPIVPVPVPLCRAIAWLLGLVMKRPPLTPSAIAGVINDADLDPAEATLDIGYRPLGVREGFRLCFPNPREALANAESPSPVQVQKGNAS